MMEQYFTEIITVVTTLVTGIGGWEGIKYLFNRKTNKRIAEAEADKAEIEASGTEFTVLKEAMTFLQEQVKSLTAHNSELLEKLHKKNDDLNELGNKCTKLETINQLKLCEKRGCKDRQPQTGY